MGGSGGRFKFDLQAYTGQLGDYSGYMYFDASLYSKVHLGTYKKPSPDDYIDIFVLGKNASDTSYTTIYTTSKTGSSSGNINDDVDISNYELIQIRIKSYSNYLTMSNIYIKDCYIE